MFKTVVIINKKTGAKLAELALMPFASLQFGFELNNKLQRVFVVRNAKTTKIYDSVFVGNEEIKIKIIKK